MINHMRKSGLRKLKTHPDTKLLQSLFSNAELTQQETLRPILLHIPKMIMLGAMKILTKCMRSNGTLKHLSQLIIKSPQTA